jgi:hypothetical protein
MEEAQGERGYGRRLDVDEPETRAREELERDV